jgi:hypothetical protein
VLQLADGVQVGSVSIPRPILGQCAAWASLMISEKEASICLSWATGGTAGVRGTHVTCRHDLGTFSLSSWCACGHRNDVTQSEPNAVSVFAGPGPTLAQQQAQEHFMSHS